MRQLKELLLALSSTFLVIRCMEAIKDLHCTIFRRCNYPVSEWGSNSTHYDFQVLLFRVKICYEM